MNLYRYIILYYETEEDCFKKCGGFIRADTMDAASEKLFDIYKIKSIEISEVDSDIIVFDDIYAFKRGRII